MYIDFEYAGQKLSDFGCMMCHINTNSGFLEVDIGCDITFTTVKNRHSSIHSVTSSAYENVYTATFDIMKSNCHGADNDIYMNSLDIRNLTKWLNRREYHKFRIFNDISIESDVSYYGSFNIKQLMYGNSIIGLSLTFTSNSPYGLGSLIDLNFYLGQAGESFNIHGDSDEYGVIYPTITIQSLVNQDIVITNQTTGTEVCINNCLQNELITIDGEHKLITTDNDSHNTLTNDFNYEYFDILIDEFDTGNEYTVSAPCIITVNYYPIRKVGVY